MPDDTRYDLFFKGNVNVIDGNLAKWRIFAVDIRYAA